MTTTASRLAPDPSTRGRGKATGGDTATVLALLPIGADLLPRTGGAGGHGRRTRALAVGLVLAAGLGVGGAWAYAQHQRSSAVTSLTAAQDRQRDLQARERSFQQVATVQTQATALRTALAGVMATDTPWSTVLTDLARIRGGVTFTSVQGAVADPAAAGAATTTSGAAVTPGGVGTLTISGTAADQPTVASFVEALDGVGGFADAFLSNVASTSGADAGGYTFTVTVSLTADLRTAAPSRWSTGAPGAPSAGGGK